MLKNVDIFRIKEFLKTHLKYNMYKRWSSTTLSFFLSPTFTPISLRRYQLQFVRSTFQPTRLDKSTWKHVGSTDMAHNLPLVPWCTYDNPRNWRSSTSSDFGWETESRTVPFPVWTRTLLNACIYFKTCKMTMAILYF